MFQFTSWFVQLKTYPPTLSVSTRTRGEASLTFTSGTYVVQTMASGYNNIGDKKIYFSESTRSRDIKVSGFK